jgi:hypothetical protein
MGPKLLATPARWSSGTLLLAGLAWVAVRGLPAWFGPERERVPVAAVGWAVLSAAFWLYLRGEEARLARELRVARSGTSVQRRALLRRRRPTPYFGIAMFWYAAVRVLGALASTTLGHAAVLVAEGELQAARATLAGFGQLLAVGPLRELRAAVEADLARAVGTEESLATAIKALYAAPPFAHVEAERYRMHVLVKALLQQGDEATARTIAEDLKASTDDELRVYAVWLRTWFEWTHLDAPSEPDMRLALLLARTHGALDLVARLEIALAAAAPSTSHTAAP